MARVVQWSGRSPLLGEFARILSSEKDASRRFCGGNHAASNARRSNLGRVPGRQTVVPPTRTRRKGVDPATAVGSRYRDRNAGKEWSRVMPRRLRVSTGGDAEGVLNRRVGRERIFAKPRDFERVVKWTTGPWNCRVVGSSTFRHHRPRPSWKRCGNRWSGGGPFGEGSWQEQTGKRLGLQSTLRPRGRPWPKPRQ